MEKKTLGRMNATAGHYNMMPHAGCEKSFFASSYKNQQKTDMTA